jgi:curved DNA-binding protein CbpA
MALVLAASKDYYEVLELQPTCTEKDIKKAYRTLALKWHPDKNKGSEESNARFKEIAEAYEVLGDASARRDYDASRRTGSSGSSKYQSKFRSRRSDFDPFAQFNDLFTNDPFFKAAFDDMDAMLQKVVQEGLAASTKAQRAANEQSQDSGLNSFFSNALGSAAGWAGRKILDSLDMDINVQTTEKTVNGKTSSKWSFGGQSKRRGGKRGTSSSTSTYTSKSSRTVIENGKKITIQSLEKDGNKIEERYFQDKLVERKVNGVVLDVERIAEF